MMSGSPHVRRLIVALWLLTMAGAAAAHDVAASDKAFVEGVNGPAVLPFLYLGAKHMVTGYDHILFLIGVVFFLRRLKDVILYVSMFTIGHSLTLIGGAFFGWKLPAQPVEIGIAVSILVSAIHAWRRISRQ